jgi:hypothetical protein
MGSVVLLVCDSVGFSVLSLFSSDGASVLTVLSSGMSGPVQPAITDTRRESKSNMAKSFVFIDLYPP